MAEICKGRTKHGPCPNRPLTGKDFCNVCAILRDTSTPTGRIKAYRLGQWQQRLDELATDDATKNLVEEIGILKMTLEAVFNSCTSASEILANTFKISDLTVKIEKLISSCHKLQQSHGQLLDKSSILKLAGSIIGIIQRHITDPVIVEAIASEIVAEIATIDPNETED